MGKISDIKDRGSLEAWLNARPEATRQQDAVTIAHRAAMRVLPLYLNWIAGRSPENDLTSLPIARVSLISGVASLAPTPEIKSAAAAAANANANAYAAAYANANAAAYAAAAAAAAAYANANAAAYAAAYANANANANANAYAAAYANANANAAAAAAANAWKEIRADAEKIMAVPARPLGPLWQDPTKDPFTSEWDAALKAWQTAETDWSFWITWATAIRNGTPQNLQMLTEIATQDNDFWQGTAPEINARIAEIVEKYDLLDQARTLQVSRQTTIQTTASVEHRNHNQPPELIDTPVEITQAITIIWAGTDDAVEEMEQPVE